MNQHPRYRAFASLSLRDLLDAREAYHIHLTNLDNVIATAVGRYLIHKDDWFAQNPPTTKPPADYVKPAGEKTLFNTVVREWSWPCVLVFVQHWLEPREFGEHPERAVPPALYLADGRVVPTCVVKAQLSTRPPGRSRQFFPRNILGGGYLVSADVQGQEHIGTVGCLVTDGHTTYALTNRHVVGPPGEEVFSYVGGKRVRVGVSSDLQTSKRPFSEVYPAWPGQRAVTNLDCGLVRVDDVNDWTSQVFGLGELGPMIDIHPDNLTVEIIDRKVKAFGGASGPLCGKIRGLFYRYKSLAGLDYMADMLVAPDAGSGVGTHHGDSGTLWCLEGQDSEAKQRPQPIALQWGGHSFAAGDASSNFALATFLSTVSRELDVDLVRDRNTGLPEYWGELGHYAIGNRPWELIGNESLKTLMKANANNFGFDSKTLRTGELYKIHSAHYDFVPLADVADDVWRGRPSRTKDESNHFADMDEPGKGEFKGKTLLDVCEDEDNVLPSVWDRFYDSIGTDEAHKGALPFRVWQLYEEMVAFVSNGKALEFVATAGVLAHYVGDASQPLHVSRLHHGHPPVRKGSVAYKVHSIYETKMLDDNAKKLVKLLDEEVKKLSVPKTFKGGRNAARKVVALMRKTVEQLPPETVIETYSQGHNDDERAQILWDTHGPKTAELMARSVRLLAQLWESAWVEGDGDTNIAEEDLAEMDPEELKKLYLRASFARSLNLGEMVDLLEK